MESICWFDFIAVFVEKIDPIEKYRLDGNLANPVNSIGRDFHLLNRGRVQISVDVFLCTPGLGAHVVIHECQPWKQAMPTLMATAALACFFAWPWGRCFSKTSAGLDKLRRTQS